MFLCHILRNFVGFNTRTTSFLSRNSSLPLIVSILSIWEIHLQCAEDKWVSKAEDGVCQKVYSVISSDDQFTSCFLINLFVLARLSFSYFLIDIDIAVFALLIQYCFGLYPGAVYQKHTNLHKICRPLKVKYIFNRKRILYFLRIWELVFTITPSVVIM